MSTHTLDLEAIELNGGSHDSPDEGHCLLEVVSMFAGEPFTDSPKCVSQVLRSFGISLNDRWSNKQRQKLKQFIPLLPGTADDGQDEARAYLALDWLIRVYTPTWLRLVPALTADADLLANQGPITSLDDLGPTNEVMRNAVVDNAWKTTGVVAWSIARTGLAAARDAAGEAAMLAAGEVAFIAARSAWIAARNAVWLATKEVWATSRAALTTTVETLQESALDLFARMINPAQNKAKVAK